MSRHRTHRVDVNQSVLVDALREIPGVTVKSLTGVGEGCPDLLVGYAGRNYLLEIKRPGGMMSPEQIAWFTKWAGQCMKVETLGEALLAIGLQT